MKNATFVPLHTKSDRSAGYGTGAVSELVGVAARCGIAALALTDVENLYGQVELHHAAKRAGLRAITGVELRRGFGAHSLGERRGRLVLVARDREGYESLCRIVTKRRSRLEPTPDPLACLDDAPRGVFYLSDDADTIESLLARGVGPDDVRFLLVRPSEPRPAPRGVRAVADIDAVMIEERDRPLHELLAAIRLRMKVREVAAWAEPSVRALESATRVATLFADVPEALAESVEVAAACTLDLCDVPRVVPAWSSDDGSADAELVRRCAAAIEGRDTMYATRLARELDVIRALGVAPYFLVVASIADRARSLGIAVAGRGSAASSLACFALGITHIDPIANGLIFERFMRIARSAPPDIDLDLPSDRRDEIVDWVFERFGRDRVAGVVAFHTFKRRSAFREGLAALGMRANDITRFCESVPDGPNAESASPPTAMLPAGLQRYVPLVERLVGKLHHVSTHPGALVIADGPLVRHVPLERAPKGVLVTQYDHRSLAQLGMMKIDLLGNRALSALDETKRSLGGRARREEDEGIERVVDALRTGDTIGCFQVETPAIRSVLRKVPVRDVRALANVLALVRPGPGAGDAKAAFVRRARGEEPAASIHPALDDVLAQTHGMILFEEDLIIAIARLTNASLEEADAVRSAIVDADESQSALAKVEHAFRSRAIPGAADLWPELARFASYAFNRAHALAYADLAWRAVATSVHHPIEHACAVMNHYGGAYPLRTVVAAFARRGLSVLPPDVNVSMRAHAIEEREARPIRIGLGAVKGLTKKTQRALFEERPFRDVADLLARTPLSARELRALVLSGACDGLAPLSPRGYPIAHDALLAHARRDRSLVGFVACAPGGPRADAYRSLVRVRNEVEILGMHPSDHPLRVLRSEAVAAGAHTIAEAASSVGHHVRIAGIVAASRRIEARGGKTMQFVTLEDETEIIELVLFPGAYAALGDPITSPGPFLVDGVTTDEHGDISLAVARVVPFHMRPRPYAVT